MSYHVDEGDVDEYSGGDAEDPGCDGFEIANSDTCRHPEEAEDGGEEVADEGLLHRHPGFQQHGEVACQERKQC